MKLPANEGLIESWALSLHRKAAGTKALYLRTAAWFEDWLIAAGRPKKAPGDLLAVTRQDAEAWFTAQRDAGLSASTLRSRWIALRNLYGWATEEDELAENPMSRVKVEKGNPPPIKVLVEADVALLLKACEGTTFLDRRDLAIVRTLLATGLRLSEVMALKVENVDLARRVLFVEHGKGDKARFARFDAGTAQTLDRYKRVRARSRHAALPWLWLARDGRLSAKGVPFILDRRADAAGIGHVHAHQLRHTWAHRAKAGGMSDSDLKTLGGWESDEVMRRYGSAHAVDRALAAYDQANPMGEL
jgi:site-specific recombinase XerD